MEKITANHFITDDKTDKVYMSSLIDKSTGDLDADVRSQLKNCIRHFARKSELLYNTKDVWARDYMPIQLTKDVYLSYTYKPDYLQDIPECITNWQLHKVRTQRQYTNDEHFDFKVVHIPLILDGGNVVKATVNNKPCIIMCDKVLQENNINYEDFQNWWKNWWEENFDGTEMELVLLPWEGSKDNPIGHADGMVRYISDGQILMTNYLDYDEKFKDNHGSRIQLELEKAGFTVNRLHFMDKFEYETDKMFRLLFNKTWCYINFLQIGNSILLPSLGYEELDREAIKQVKEAFSNTGQKIKVELINIDMTNIVENMNEGQNSGGALNCLTWTVKS